MEGLYNQILLEIGEDPTREGLEKTPKRAADSMKYLTEGYSMDPETIINGALYENPSRNENMVLVRDIEFYSMCEHHILPFMGKCHVAYIPDRKIIGLSKIPRLVDCFARRLQLQEKLTCQIADTLEEFLEPKGLAVYTSARHLCMMMRGIKIQNSSVESEELRGKFHSNLETRREFLEKVGLLSEKGFSA